MPVKRLNINDNVLPSDKLSDYYIDARKIFDGEHQYKTKFFPLPVSIAELDEFTGFKNFDKDNPVKLSSDKKTELRYHAKAIKFAIVEIMKQFVSINKLIDNKLLEMTVDYHEYKRTYRAKSAIKKKRTRPTINNHFLQKELS